MTTNRTPIQRPPTQQITRRAAELWDAMCKLPRCTCPQSEPGTYVTCANCERWYDLHSELHTELKLRPWVWPCVTRRTARDAGAQSVPNDDAYALMVALDEAARQAQRMT